MDKFVSDVVNKVPMDLYPKIYEYSVANSLRNRCSFVKEKYCSNYNKQEPGGLPETNKYIRNRILIEMLRRVPLHILTQFIKFGTPSKYYNIPQRREPTLYDYILHVNPDFYSDDIIFSIMDVLDFYNTHDEKDQRTFMKIVCSIFYVCNRFCDKDNASKLRLPSSLVIYK